LNTTAHISTIRTNSLISITLIFTFFWLAISTINNYSNITLAEKSFTEIIALNVINREIENISSVSLLTNNPNIKFNSISFSKLVKDAINHCNVNFNLKDMTPCTFSTFSNNSIRTFVLNALTNDGFCLNKTNLKYDFTIIKDESSKKLCKGEVIKFNELIINGNLFDIKKSGIPSASTKITFSKETNKSNKLYPHIRTASIENIDLGYTNKDSLYAENFSMWETNNTFQKFTLNNGIECSAQIKSPSCYYQQLNKLSSKLSGDSVSVPYISTTFKSSIACLILLSLLILTSLSSYSASQIALKNIKGGLEQNYFPFDYSSNKISNFCIQIHRYCFGICFLITALFIVPIDFFITYLSKPDFFTLSLDPVIQILIYLGIVVVTILPIKLIEPLNTALLELRKERQENYNNPTL
jgi:hypothetical protein